MQGKWHQSRLEIPMSEQEPLPTVEIFDHTDGGGLDLQWLEKMASLAMPQCLANPGTEEPVLPGLTNVEVSLISDEAIAQVHEEFMDDPTATDVITFHHGEILISTDTAKREGPTHGNTEANETLLYLIHGLLHLNGHTDLSEPERTRMHACQESILKELILGDSGN